MTEQDQTDFTVLSNFKANDKQMEAYEAVKLFKYLFYGGAAGGGKSYFLRWIAIYLLMYYYMKYGLSVRVGLFCEDYPALKERHLSKISIELPEFIGKFHSDHKEHGKALILDKDYGGGVLVFRNLDEPSKYLSSEFASVLIDELTMNTRRVFDFLASMRMRWPGIPDPKFVGASNPGGVGMGWVKKLWIRRDFTGENFDPEEFKFVSARYYDNPFLDKSYEKQLDGLPEKLRQAYKDGDWDTFEGQYFEEWNTFKHVSRPFEIPREWERYITMDWGLAKPLAIYWIAVDFDQRAWVYRELYTTGLIASDAGRRIKQMSMVDFPDVVEEKLMTKYRFFSVDPSVFAKKGEGTKSIGSTMQEELGRVLLPAKNDRINGWMRMREWLADAPDGKPWMIFFDTCVHAIRTIPEMVYAKTDGKRVAKNKYEDCDTLGEDHAGDSIRYFCVCNPKKMKKKEEPNYEGLTVQEIDRAERLKKSFTIKKPQKGVRGFLEGLS